MKKKLIAAYSTKEKAESFLSNLERLKETDSIEGAQYDVLKAEYTKMREDALFKANSLKASLKKELDSKAGELDIIKVKLSYLEARFKVGQITKEAYTKQEKGPRKKAAELEKQYSDLEKLANSHCLADIGIITDDKKTGFKVPWRKKEVPELSELTDVPKVDETIQPDIITEAIEEEVEEVVEAAPAAISITNLLIMPDRVTQGSSVGIIATATNENQYAITRNIELVINAEVKDSSEITIASGESLEITFITIAEAPGDYEIAIGDSTGRFSVMPDGETSH